jgi:hypothetical protein
MDFDLENTRRELIAMRVKHGAETPVGHRISNLIEQCENLRTAEGEQRAHLIKSIDRSMTEIKALTPDHPGTARQ